MLEHAVYSVISPEGCASILWRSAEQRAGRRRGAAADRAGPAAPEVIDAIVPEPLGAAHREPVKAINALGEAIGAGLRELQGIDGNTLRAQRREKFIEMGRNGLG